MLKEQIHSGRVAQQDSRRAMEEFTQKVAHDLNAPLRCIVGFSQLLEERCCSELDEKALHYVELIQESGRKAQQLLAGLLQYSRLDTVPLAPAPVDCTAVLNACLRHFWKEIERRQARVEVQPLPVLAADGERLALLFSCLLDNALKFSAREPLVAISATRADRAWEFCVRDHGIGIAPKDHEIVFNIFHRLHPEKEYPGNGMGLALAHRIVELHGGRIWVESRVEEGAAFYFTLPA